MQNYLKLAKNQIEQNKPLELVKRSIGLHILQEHKNDFYESMRREYDLKYPEYRSMNDDEKALYVEYIKDKDSTYDDSVDIIYPDIKIDYSDDSSYITFDEYKNEEIVVSDTIYYSYDEYMDTRFTPAYAGTINAPTRDEYEGNESDFILSVKEFASIEKVRPYIPYHEITINSLVDSHPLVMNYAKSIEESNKDDTLSRLTVSLDNGKVFYADAESRLDIRDAIETAIDKGLTNTIWKLAEPFNGSKNTLVTLEELKEASFLALSAKAHIVGVTDV